MGNTHPISEARVFCRSLDGDSRKWHAFLIVSVVTPFLVAIPFALYRIYKRLTRKPQNDPYAEEKVGFFVRWNEYLASRAFHLASDQTPGGQIMKLTGVCVALASLVVYWRDTTPLCGDVEMCERWSSNTWWNADLAFNCFFLIYYIIRLLAAQNKLAFIFESYSIVDYFTVPPTFVAIGLDRNWMGLRFLRIFNMMWIVDLLHRRGIVQSAGGVQLGRLVVSITIAVIAGAGMFYLLECGGDPWNIEGSMQLNQTYWNFVYFSVVTLSTVGYGDMGTKTILGRIFCCLYIFSCLFYIASFISTAASLVPPLRRYPKFDTVMYSNHVILCGNITRDAVNRFVQEFYQDVVRSKGIYIIVLHSDDPDNDMVLFLQEWQIHVEYIRGSVLNDYYLEKARTRHASAVIILADPRASDPDAEDAKHILEVIAIKTYCPDVRVQMQVLKSASMAFLKGYAAMDFSKSDVVLCQQNMEMAFVGMNCLIPGFSTFFSDMVLTNKNSVTDVATLPPLYIRGRQMHVTCVTFSPAFAGLTVPEVAEMCFVKWNVILIAVYIRGKLPMQFHHIIPNAASDVTITSDLMGQVIAPSPQHAKAIEIFCHFCHSDATGHPVAIKPCFCQNGGVKDLSDDKASNGVTLRHAQRRNTDPSELGVMEKLALTRLVSQRSEPSATPRSDEKGTQLDSTGMYYFVPPRKFEDSVLTLAEAGQRDFEGHVVILVHSSEDAGLLGLYNMIRPMRSSSTPYEEIPEVVVVGEGDRLRMEWPNFSMLPKVTLIEADPSRPNVLRTLQLETCKACVVVSSTAERDQSSLLIDKEVVISTLRVRGMQLSDVPVDTVMSHPYFSRGIDLPLICHLDNESSVRFLSDESSGSDYSHTVPHMSGQILASTTLESLLIPAYYNPSIIRLCSLFVFGGQSAELKKAVVDGAGPQGGLPSSFQLKTTIKMMDVDSPRFRQFVDKQFVDLFVYALRDHGMICFGLYRLFDRVGEANWRWGKDTRYVATNPPGNLLLKRTDRLYVLMPAQIQ